MTAAHFIIPLTLLLRNAIIAVYSDHEEKKEVIS